MEKFRGESIESIANYAGNDSLLLLERVKHPVIREQIIELLCKGEESMKGEMFASVNERGEIEKDADGNTIERPYTPKTREEIEKLFDADVERESSYTDFKKSDASYEGSSSHKMVIGSLAPWNDRPFTEKQMSIIEAHEKGHNIRLYSSPFFREYFRKALKFDPLSFSDEEVKTFRKALDKEENEESDDTVREFFAHYMSNAVEIAERMSQLKNYFGMKGADEFTKEHLEYAREYYVMDTGMDNGMNIFFRAITPDTEGEFLRLINNSGI